ncbi:myeloid leukemia factor 1 [Trichonephila inaurata madagascariensis]|uniref:Myeloid leukemia factor 1 n=1 Tax=Trichonephila inaurata madagascariensis TaxID=2747483 RepID=A0A8X7C032_9ARAC|nr:myeloid leukemia factor 1 [Trichonephila inaurata madagascariensis]
MFSLMRDFNDDPFFSGPMESMRRMESMMDSMMSPFGLFAGGQRAIENHDNRTGGRQNMLMPFGFGGSLFPNMDDMFANFNQMGNDPNCHSFSSSSVMTYTTDETGQPQVYQASSSTRTAPGGVKETRHSVQDSRSGLQKMAIGHHLNDKGHVIEKKKNRYTGDEEENEEFINLEDDETERFDREWQQRAQVFNRGPVRSMIGYDESPRRARSQPEMLAITDGTSHPEASGAAKKKSGKHKRRHGPLGHKSSSSHNRPSPYQ